MYKKKLLFTTRIPNLDNDNNSGNGGDSGYQSMNTILLKMLSTYAKTTQITDTASAS